MNFLEAIAKLQKPENIKTKCIRPVAWSVGGNACYDHYILEDFDFRLVVTYQTENYDPYESNPFYIPYHVDVLTGEWLMCDIPVLPDCVDEGEE